MAVGKGWERAKIKLEMCHKTTEVQQVKKNDGDPSFRVTHGGKWNLFSILNVLKTFSLIMIRYQTVQKKLRNVFLGKSICIYVHLLTHTSILALVKILIFAPMDSSERSFIIRIN